MTPERSSSVMASYLIATIFCAAMVSMIGPSGALLCYTCSYSWGSQDDSCLVEPKFQTNCTKKFCTIVRQELVQEDGKVATFLRGCEDKLVIYNSVVTDSTFKTYYRSCTSDLCNDSDGKKSTASLDPNVGATANMVIKGKPWK